ncbi:MAG: YcgL domain-containing protein [Candidatus Thiodiazotropha taylori]|nr:YcgL domain-containing protein [Candidatus Thiodiazotropha taylori]
MTGDPLMEMSCCIYRSSKKDEMYLYVPEEGDFSNVPDALLKRFGRPEKVMELTLNSSRKLAREEVSVVMQNLTTQGFHLQLPPKMDVELYRGD